MKKRKMIDLTGEKFGRLLVLSFNYRDSSYKSYWNCVCLCGNRVSVRGDSLKNGHTKSCGCQKIDSAKMKLENLGGKRFGRLLVKKHIGKTPYGSTHWWECLCECGNIVKITALHLKSGRSKSCGCLHKEIMSSRIGNKNPLWRNAQYSRKKYSKTWNNELKEFIRNRDNRVCQYPGCTYDDTKELNKLHVHHIDRNKKNCKPYNLISLCNSHHIKVEHKHELWMEYLYSITSDYEVRI